MNRSKRILLIIIGMIVAGSLAADTDHATRALLTAAANRDVEAIRAALGSGASPDDADEHGNTPLMLMAGESLFGSNRTIISELIEMGAVVDKQNVAGATALMYAAQGDRRETVRMLLAAGAKPGVKDSEGWTALMHAAFNGSEGALDALIAANASVTLEDVEGWTPMLLAISNGKGNVVETLKKAGAKVPTEFHGASTLFYAIQSGDLASFRAVLAAGGSIDSPDPDGWTPLAWATISGQEQMVMDLLRAGADPSVTDSEGKTALDRAKETGLVEIIAILGGDWEKPEPRGTKVSVNCKALGGSVDSWVSADESSLIVQTVFPRPVSWYMGGGLTNRAPTSKTFTHDGVVAGRIHLDIDNDPKTGAKGAEFTVDHSEFAASVSYAYRSGDGETRRRQVTAIVIDVSVLRGDDAFDPDEWFGEYPRVFSESGVLRTEVPLLKLGLSAGQKITVTTEFGKCVSKPTKVNLE